MANKLKNFLFPSKDEDEFNTTTIQIDKDTIKDSGDSNNANTTIFNPIEFKDCENIANELLNRKSVIVDLTNTNIQEAKRICDFLNGVTYAVNGSVKKIAKLVYLFNPNK